MKSKNNTSIWLNQPKRISIVVPTRDMVHSGFAFSLTQLIKTSENAGIETFLFFNSGSVLLNQREKLIKSSMEVESDYTLWLDSDMTFPSTTLLRLLSHDKEIVGCNYKKRSNPQTPVAYKEIGNWDSWVSLDEEKDLVEVEGVGMGCILIKTDLFKEINKPYFEFTYNKETDDWLGEDFNLFGKFRNIGKNIYIDTNLSREIGHLGIYKFGSSNQ
ncbi:ANP1/MMN9/VAN1 family protein [bacterium]|nr:ANP1/MMN9/VAN1 family protein [bacterium]